MCINAIFKSNKIIIAALRKPESTSSANTLNGVMRAKHANQVQLEWQLDYCCCCDGCISFAAWFMIRK